ncbi:MAG TPA: 50S ribosomal protein L11 methyltransferase [Spirochaetota bacterium]|nr:50S ribosomal protein L11 methyltransferase [Spirochaetota bacterium]
MFQLKIVIKNEQTEEYESALFEAGASSVSISEAGDDNIAIIALFFESDAAYRILDKLNIVGTVTPLLSDYSDRWLDYIDVEDIGDGLTVCKIDENSPSAEVLEKKYGMGGTRCVIGIDARGTFGIGVHPTSRICVGMIREVLKYVYPQESSCADIGSGSGVLSIYAAKLGFGEVVACDISADACLMTEKNSLYNRCRVKVVNCGIKQFNAGPFDVVVANIPISLTEISINELESRVRIGGYLLLSGFGLKWKDYVSSAFSKAFTAVFFTTSGDWGGYIMKKEQ